MAVVNIINKNIKINVKEGSLLSDVIRKELNIETPCNGKGICGKCKVIASGNLSKVLDLEKSFIKGDERLACMTRVIGDASVNVLYTFKNMKSINSGYRRNFIKEENRNSGYSIALDLGTTGISGYLIDYSLADVVSKSSTLNRQVEYGADVLSRAEYQMSRESGIKDLKNKAIESINCIIKSLTEEKGNFKDIKSIYIAGNTIMLHMLLGEKVDSLVTAPYESVFLESRIIDSSELNICVDCPVILLPSISSYVGADITSGMYACDFASMDNSVYIDIGTNGEIGVNINGNIYVSATAAGPAFEGSNISCGMRAEDGAIDSFKIIDNSISFTTINNLEPVGICGSGIIDIIGEFIKNNIILKSGKINKDEAEKYFKVEDKKVFITNSIYISQEDIRAFQLAKGAIVSGINILTKRAGLNNIKEFAIGGSFGYHLNEDSLKRIGIVPKEFSGKVRFLGNVSLEGAFLASMNSEYLEDMNKMIKEIHPINLSLDSEFQNEFIKSLRF